jgi:hypothetical protein
MAYKIFHYYTLLARNVIIILELTSDIHDGVKERRLFLFWYYYSMYICYAILLQQSC